MNKMTLLLSALVGIVSFTQCFNQKSNIQQTAEKVEKPVMEHSPEADQANASEQTYIIMFKRDGLSDSNDTKNTGRGSSGVNKDEFEKFVHSILKEYNVPDSKVEKYFSALKGISIKLTDNQAMLFRKNIKVQSIEADSPTKMQIGS